jgi:glycosyltransferase involved in cell wall biosynthesis
MVLLSILIPHVIDRSEMLSSLIKNLTNQIYRANLLPHQIEILTNQEQLSIGEKRNKLLEQSKGKYVCFIDDDDDVSSDYINLLLEGISKDVDCCSLRGVITVNGESPKLFEHSIKYNQYKVTNNEIVYERYPNHLNCIKSDIAKQFKFVPINYGEDTQWATQINKSGLIKTEHFIDKVIYHYKYIIK